LPDKSKSPKAHTRDPSGKKGNPARHVGVVLWKAVFCVETSRRVGTDTQETKRALLFWRLFPQSPEEQGYVTKQQIIIVLSLIQPRKTPHITAKRQILP
jgi:hypothetical protein